SVLWPSVLWPSVLWPSVLTPALAARSQGFVAAQAAASLAAALGSERTLDRLDVEALDDVAGPQVLIVGERHAAFLPRRHLSDLALEALQGRERSLVDHDVVADEPHLGTALDLPLGHAAASDLADLGDIEDLEDGRVTQRDLAQGGCEQPRHRRLHVVDEIVDDVVVADLDARLVGQRLGLDVGAHVEPYDHRMGRVGKRHVRFGDAADAGVHDARLDLLGAELFQCACNGLDRALYVALDEQRELLASGLLQLLHHLLERARRRCRAQGLSALARAIVGDLARSRLIFDDCERITGLGRGVEAQDLDRHRGAGRGHGLATIVDQRAHAPPRCTGDDDIADVQGATLHEHGTDGAATPLELGLDHHAF